MQNKLQWLALFSDTEVTRVFFQTCSDSHNMSDSLSPFSLLALCQPHHVIYLNSQSLILKEVPIIKFDTVCLQH